MKQSLAENIYFNYSDSFFKDVNTLTPIIEQYYKDRKAIFEQLYNDKDCTEQDLEEYFNYFTTASTEMTKDVYETLFRIQHFFDREYEIFINPQVLELRNSLLDFVYNSSFLNKEAEQENIFNFRKNWKKFKQVICEIPSLDLDKQEYKNLFGVQCYFDPNTQSFVVDTINSFMQNIHSAFPNTLLKLDTVLIVDKDYLQFLAGDDSTQAFFTDNCLFLASSCDDTDDPEEKIFFETVLYHEFGHFIFSLLSETSQIMWFNLYKDWQSKDVKMTRDKDKNSQLYNEEGQETGENIEELFADTFAMKFVGEKTNNNFYIHKPSSLITDSLDFILRNEFTK